MANGKQATPPKSGECRDGAPAFVGKSAAAINGVKKPGKGGATIGHPGRGDRLGATTRPTSE